MKRPARARGATSVSLFPFLAVLLCTMGSLIVVLVVIAQQARSEAERQENVQRERWEQQRREALASASQLEQQREAALAERENLQAEVAARRRELDALSARIASLESELARLHEQSTQLPEDLVARQSHDEIEQQLTWYRRRIAQVEEAIRTANQKHGNGKTFAILPYAGKSGTERRPIYIECRSDRVVLQPEGIELRAADFIHSRALSPLNAAVLATIDHFEQADPLHRGYAYPMLLVRPDGIESYYRVLETLQQFRTQYGYEFIEQDWELELPPSDKQLAQKQLEAVQMARRQLMRELQTRPGLVRGKPPSFSLSATGGGLRMVDGGEPGGLGSLPDRYGADSRGNARETGRGGYPDQPYAGGGTGIPGGSTGGNSVGGPAGFGSGSALGSDNGMHSAGALGGDSALGSGSTSDGQGFTSLADQPGAETSSLAGPRYPQVGGYSSTPYRRDDPHGAGLAGSSAGQSHSESEATSHSATGSYPNTAGQNAAGNFGSGNFSGGNFAGGGQTAQGNPMAQGSQAGGGRSASAAPGGTAADRGYWITGGERPSADALASGGGYGWSRNDQQSRASSNPYADIALPGTSPGSTAMSGSAAIPGSAAMSGSGAMSGSAAMSGGSATPGGASSSLGGSTSPSANNAAGPDSAAGLAGRGAEAASQGVNGGTASNGASASGASSESAEGASGAGSGAGRPGSMNAGAASGGAAGSPSSSESGAGVPQLTMQHPPATHSVAASAGSNWALPHSSARSVAVWRDIRVRLEPDRMLLVSETGRVTQLVPLRGATAASTYEIRNAVWQDMEHWGIAGYGMHWQPVLHVDVARGAEQRFRDLQVLFDNSGFAIRDRHAARSGGQPAPQRQSAQPAASRAAVP